MECGMPVLCTIAFSVHALCTSSGIFVFKYHSRHNAVCIVYILFCPSFHGAFHDTMLTPTLKL